MQGMDDFTFMPKKVFRFLAVVLVLGTVIYSLFVGPEKATQAYMRGVQMIAAPITNRMEHRLERIQERIEHPSSEATEKD